MWNTSSGTQIKWQIGFFEANTNDIWPIEDLLWNPIKDLNNRNLWTVKDLLDNDDEPKKIKWIWKYTKDYKPTSPKKRKDIY